MSILSITKTLFKSLFHGPYTDPYPIIKKPAFEDARGSVTIDIDTCIFCSICQKRCPTGAIVVNKAEGSWEIDRLKCIQCSYCVKVCPKKCLGMDGDYTPPCYESAKDEYKNARISDNKADN